MKILILDIENSYLLLGGWGIFNQNMGIDQILDSGKVLCYAAKWHNSKEIIFREYTDKDFISTIYNLLDDADAVVTFNGRRHDVPLLNREFIKDGLGPPSPFTHIDLLQTAKKHFKFPSNKLDWLLRELKLGTKLQHEGFPLWVKYLTGCPKARATMKRYNIRDVARTQALYKKLLPWITSHPNHALYKNSAQPVCVTCGSSNLQHRGERRTLTQVYKRLRCMSCGHWNRERISGIPTDRRKLVLTDA